MSRLRHLGLLLVLASVCAAAQPPLPVRLDTSFEEPYQVVVDGQLGGLSVTVLECIFNRMQQPYQIQLTSLQRARRNVSRQIADGFFSSAPNSLVDGYAVLSAPLLEQLVAMLRHGRINMLLADNNAMQSTLQQAQGEQKLHQRFVRYSPLGVYFSKNFIDEHPDFLKAFNRQVESCAPASTELSQAEQAYLRQLATQHVARWGLHADLLSALREAPQRDNSHERIQELDRQWRRERILEEKPLIRRMLKLRPSQLLAGIAQQYSPLFNEIFISDASGQLVALSEPTSDYWQADEVDFQRAERMPAGEVYIGAIEYDGSTQSFQSKVSAPLYDPDTGALLGVISLGINIGTAFGDNLP